MIYILIKINHYLVLLFLNSRCQEVLFPNPCTYSMRLCSLWTIQKNWGCNWSHKSSITRSFQIIFRPQASGQLIMPNPKIDCTNTQVVILCIVNWMILYLVFWRKRCHDIKTKSGRSGSVSNLSTKNTLKGKDLINNLSLEERFTFLTKNC